MTKTIDPDPSEIVEAFAEQNGVTDTRRDKPQDTRQCDHCCGKSTEGNHEWHSAFRMPDPDNPSHIIHNGEPLCSVSLDSLRVPSKIPRTIRETLLSPHGYGPNKSNYCETCLSAFRNQYDFNLGPDDHGCPNCGSEAKAVTHPVRGVVDCHACDWER